MTLTIPQNTPQLSAITVTKTIITKIIFYTILCLLAAIVINRGFAIWQRKLVFSHVLEGSIMIVVFLVIFPLLYIRQIKSLAMLDTVRYLRATYRDEITHLIIDKAITRGAAQSQSTSASLSVSAPAQFIASLRTQFPGVTRWLFDYCTKQFPIIQKIPELLGEIDFTKPDTAAIKQRVLDQLQPYLGDSHAAPHFGYGVWKLLAWNIVLLGGLYAMLHYM